MVFDNGSWYIIVTIISAMVIIIGVMITVISKFVVLNPMSELKRSIDILVATLNEMKTFIELQKSHNLSKDAEIVEIYAEIDKANKIRYKDFEKCANRLDEQHSQISELKHGLANHLQSHISYKLMDSE